MIQVNPAKGATKLANKLKPSTWICEVDRKIDTIGPGYQESESFPVAQSTKSKNGFICATKSLVLSE
jgi:hypothetical protein